MAWRSRSKTTSWNSKTRGAFGLRVAAPNTSSGSSFPLKTEGNLHPL